MGDVLNRAERSYFRITGTAGRELERWRWRRLRVEVLLLPFREMGGSHHSDVPKAETLVLTAETSRRLIKLDHSKI